MRREKHTRIFNLKEPDYRKDYFGVERVDWGNQNHVKPKKVYKKLSSLKINNRFDFANDSDTLIRNYRNVSKKIPNIFNLKEKNDNNEF